MAERQPACLSSDGATQHNDQLYSGVTRRDDGPGDRPLGAGRDAHEPVLLVANKRRARFGGSASISPTPGMAQM
jgi:hypothetical protein